MKFRRFWNFYPWNLDGFEFGPMKFRAMKSFCKQTLKRLIYKRAIQMYRRTTIVHIASNDFRPHIIGHFRNFKDQRLLFAKQDCGKKNCMCMHGIQFFRLLKLRFLALMWMWVYRQLSTLRQCIAGQVMLAIFESGEVAWADMGGCRSFPSFCHEDWSEFS